MIAVDTGIFHLDRQTLHPGTCFAATEPNKIGHTRSLPRDALVRNLWGRALKHPRGLPLIHFNRHSSILIIPEAMSGSDTLVQSSQAQAASSIVAYDLALLLFRGIINIFFREVRPRGSFNIPREGPVIFVGAPHSNQVRLVALDGRRRGAKSSRTP